MINLLQKKINEYNLQHFPCHICGVLLLPYRLSGNSLNEIKLFINLLILPRKRSAEKLLDLLKCIKHILSYK